LFRLEQVVLVFYADEYHTFVENCSMIYILEICSWAL